MNLETANSAPITANGVPSDPQHKHQLWMNFHLVF
jgi:hypothetical protein